MVKKKMSKRNSGTEDEHVLFPVNSTGQILMLEHSWYILASKGARVLPAPHVRIVKNSDDDENQEWNPDTALEIPSPPTIINKEEDEEEKTSVFPPHYPSFFARLLGRVHECIFFYGSLFYVQAVMSGFIYMFLPIAAGLYVDPSLYAMPLGKWVVLVPIHVLVVQLAAAIASGPFFWLVSLFIGSNSGKEKEHLWSPYRTLPQQPGHEKEEEEGKRHHNNNNNSSSSSFRKPLSPHHHVFTSLHQIRPLDHTLTTRVATIQLFVSLVFWALGYGLSLVVLDHSYTAFVAVAVCFSGMGAGFALAAVAGLLDQHVDTPGLVPRCWIHAAPHVFLAFFALHLNNVVNGCAFTCFSSLWPNDLFVPVLVNGIGAVCAAMLWAMPWAPRWLHDTWRACSAGDVVLIPRQWTSRYHIKPRHMIHDRLSYVCQKKLSQFLLGCVTVLHQSMYTAPYLYPFIPWLVPLAEQFAGTTDTNLLELNGTIVSREINASLWLRSNTLLDKESNELISGPALFSQAITNLLVFHISSLCAYAVLAVLIGYGLFLRWYMEVEFSSSKLVGTGTRNADDLVRWQLAAGLLLSGAITSWYWVSTGLTVRVEIAEYICLGLVGVLFAPCQVLLDAQISGRWNAPRDVERELRRHALMPTTAASTSLTRRRPTSRSLHSSSRVEEGEEGRRSARIGPALTSTTSDPPLILSPAPFEPTPAWCALTDPVALSSKAYAGRVSLFFFAKALGQMITTVVIIQFGFGFLQSFTMITSWVYVGVLLLAAGVTF